MDRQVHLGVDPASTINSPVRTAYRGKVVFTGELGLYSNCVIMDHWRGPFSMDGQMSKVVVKGKQPIEKNELLRLIDSTGLATGDHLHFSMPIGGVFVNPQSIVGCTVGPERSGRYDRYTKNTCSMMGAGGNSRSGFAI